MGALWVWNWSLLKERNKDGFPGNGERGDVARGLTTYDDGGGVAGLDSAGEGIDGLEAIENRGHSNAAAAESIAAGIDRVGLEDMDPGGDADAVDGDELIANVEGKTRRPEGIDERFAVVDIGGERKKGLVLGRKNEFVVGIVEASDVANANIVKGEVVARIFDLIEPGLEIQQIKAEDLSFPVEGAVVLVVKSDKGSAVSELLLLSELRETTGSEAQECHNDKHFLHETSRRTREQKVPMYIAQHTEGNAGTRSAAQGGMRNLTWRSRSPNGFAMWGRMRSGRSLTRFTQARTTKQITGVSGPNGKSRAIQGDRRARATSGPTESYRELCQFNGCGSGPAI
jgi:hypothetical protein